MIFTAKEVAFDGMKELPESDWWPCSSIGALAYHLPGGDFT
jgi:hypothetical protein